MDNPIYIAFDNEDKNLGHFYQSCHDRIREVAVENGFDYRSFTSQSLTKENIDTHTSEADELNMEEFEDIVNKYIDNKAEKVDLVTMYLAQKSQPSQSFPALEIPEQFPKVP